MGSCVEAHLWRGVKSPQPSGKTLLTSSGGLAPLPMFWYQLRGVVLQEKKGNYSCWRNRGIFSLCFSIAPHVAIIPDDFSEEITQLERSSSTTTGTCCMSGRTHSQMQATANMLIKEEIEKRRRGERKPARNRTRSRLASKSEERIKQIYIYTGASQNIRIWWTSSFCL